MGDVVKLIGVTYHRVSTIDQDPTIARLELRKAAELRGIDLVDEVEETGSGHRNDRPEFQSRVITPARRGHITHVLTWKLSRFGRSVLDVVTNVKAFKSWGVTFVATSQGLEVGPRSGAMADFTLNILAACAEFDSEIIREGTLLGLEAARRRGVKLGRPRKKDGP